MRYEGSYEQTKSLFVPALLATVAVVAVPALAAVTSVRLLPEPRPLLAILIGILIAGSVVSVGANLWLRRPESVSLAFGELMLWRYLRRRRADARIASGVEILGLAPSGEAAVEPDLEPGHQLEVLHDLSTALESKDPYTVGHSRRVERHVYRTAMVLGLHSTEIEDLRLAASLHDVGKINVPDRILRKPASLTPNERAVVQQHAPVGATMVVGTVPDSVVEAILHHHESWDGTGYPDGLAGSAIPLLARIICVADAYDAITSARPYKPGSSRREAIDILRANAGVQFDHDVVEAFVSTLPAALPVAGGLAIFAMPAESARRLSAWLKNTGGGSLTTAIGAAGMVALLGAATIVGTPPMVPPTVAAPAPAPVQPSTLDEGEAELISTEEVADEPAEPEGIRGESRDSENERALPAAAPAPQVAPASPGPSESKDPLPPVKQPSQPGEPAGDPPPDEPGPTECSEPGGGKGKATGTEKGKGHEKAKGKGHSKHCH